MMKAAAGDARRIASDRRFTAAVWWRPAKMDRRLLKHGMQHCTCVFWGCELIGNSVFDVPRRSATNSGHAAATLAAVH